MELKKWLVGFEEVGEAVLAVVLLSLLFFVWTSFFPSLLPLLSLSRSHPWGIFTALFTHADTEHLLSNLLSFISFSFLFVLLHFPRRVEVRREMALAFTLSLFLAGLGVNLVDFLYRWSSGSSSTSCGSSGIVYAVMGMVFVSSFYNFLLFSRLSLKYPSLRFPLLLAASPAVAVLLVFGWELLFHPSSFFSVAPSANVQAHVLGFIYGMVIFTFMLWERTSYRGFRS
ncbi:MAG: rhomboid family intramembrane serine protease [Candidatus Hadarchaeales archaeon]